MSIFFILLPFDKNSLFSTDVKLISFSLRLKIFDIKENEIKFSSLENHYYLKKEDKINQIDILFKKIEK